MEEAWVQCDRCDKWRRVPSASLPEDEDAEWCCISCDEPEDEWDAKAWMGKQGWFERVPCNSLIAPGWYALQQRNLDGTLSDAQRGELFELIARMKKERKAQTQTLPTKWVVEMTLFRQIERGRMLQRYKLSITSPHGKQFPTSEMLQRHFDAQQADAASSDAATVIWYVSPAGKKVKTLDEARELVEKEAARAKQEAAHKEKQAAREAQRRAEEAQAKQEEEPEEEEEEDDDAEDEEMTIDGVPSAADRAAEEAEVAEEAAVEARGGVPLYIDILYPRDSDFYTVEILRFDAATRMHTCKYFIDHKVLEEDLSGEKWYPTLEEGSAKARELLALINADYEPKKKELERSLRVHHEEKSAGPSAAAPAAEAKPPADAAHLGTGSGGASDCAPTLRLRRAATAVPRASVAPLKKGFTRCGACDGCARFKEGRSAECGTCDNCKDKPERGGPDKDKQICDLRLCEHDPKITSRAHREQRRQQNEAFGNLWISCYLAVRDRWEKDEHARRAAEREARAERMAKRANIRAERRVAKRRAAAAAAAAAAKRKQKRQGDGGETKLHKNGAAAEEGATRSPAAPRRPPPRVADAVLESNGQPGHAERFLVRWARPPKPFHRPESSWEPAHRVGNPELLRSSLEACRAVFNRKVEPRLLPEAAQAAGAQAAGAQAAPSSASSGVVALCVPESAAVACSNYLRTHWRDGKLPLRGGATACYGYATYGKTLSAHDADQQKHHTLLMTNPLLPMLREEVPGFTDIERFLIDWLHATFGIVVELYFAHGLRQSPQTLKSTGFDVHQDTEDFPFIEYTIVVKLTPDVPGEPPSRMRVVGATHPFEYASAGGGSGAFLARLFHASVEPAPDTSEHLKVAFFFRASTKGERRAQRALAAAGIGGDQEELAQRRHVAQEMSVAGKAAPPK